MKPLVLLSFSLAFLTHGFADDSFAEEPSEQVEEQPQSEMSMESDDAPEWCLSPYHDMHASMRHNEANGIGYKSGYSTLEAFGIYDGIGSGFMPFVDIRGHIFNNGYLAGNVGIGERTLFTSINHTFGSYLYYDVRRVGKGLTVNQLSPGIELVGERMEYRINGYFPLGNQKGHQYGYKFDKFTGHSIILKSKQNQAMRGGDAEVGVHIPQNTTYDVYAAAGPYYFHSSNASAWGGKVRLLGRYKENFSLEVAYSYDKLFRNVVQGSIAFTVPFGGTLQRCGKCCPQTDNLLLSRAAFAPSRFEIPVVKKVHKHEKAIDPATGKPWVVWFVNNTSHSAGTFESPFPTLLQAQNASSPNDMIYVFPGDGTTNGMNAGITLQDGQSFFGSGIKQHFATTKGTKTIPAMSSNNPTITTAAVTDAAVTLGNGNVVSGFNILNTAIGSLGISSPAGGVNGATIMNNVITFEVGGAGITGIGASGFGNFNISNNQITGIGNGNGIIAESLGGTMNGVLSNNLISSTAIGTVILYTSGSGNITIEGNTITNYSTIGILANLGGKATLTVAGNTIGSNLGIDGIFLEDGVAPVPSLTSSNVIIDRNNLVSTSSSGANGIFVDIIHSPASNSNVSVTNNGVQSTKGAGFTGINITTGNANTICLDWDKNTVVTVPGATAYGFTTTGSGVINIESPIVGNVGGPMVSTGDVNFVAPGTCGN